MATVKNIADTVRELIEPTATGLGLFLWDVEFLKEGSRRVLRVTIDKEEGVTIEDCEAMHRAIDPILDEADPIDTSYDLEVSSPGIERELRTDVHINACLGEKVALRLFAPQNGKKSFEGILAGLDETGAVLLDIGEDRLAFPRASIAKLTTVFDF